MRGSRSNCRDSTPDPRPPENSTTRTAGVVELWLCAIEEWLVGNRPGMRRDPRRRAAALLAARPHEELDVRHHLLHRRHVHLAGAQATRALRVADPVPVLLAGRAEVQLLGIVGEHVAEDLAVLAEVQTPVRVQHDALGLERARRLPVI